MFRKDMKIKLGVIFGIIAICLGFLGPTIRYAWKNYTGEFDKLNKAEKDKLKEFSINLGLDLQGGMDLVLQVDVQKIRQMGMEKIQDQMMRDLGKLGVTDFSILPIDAENFTLKIGNVGDDGYSRITEVLNKIGTLEVTRPTGGIVFGKKEVDLFYNYDVAMNDAVERALEVIRNRIDELGVMEPLVKRIGEDLIRVQLPGETDPVVARQLLGKTAMLEFKIVQDVKYTSTDEAELEPGTEQLFGKQIDDKETGLKKMPFYILEAKTLLTGDTLTDARVAFDSMNNPFVRMDFNPEGAEIFSRISGENIGRQLAIILDNKVHSAPVFKSKISGGRAIIENIGTLDEAKQIAIVLRTGALPAPVNFVEERTVGPSLGRDSIAMGVRAVLIGLALVLIFMLWFYKFLGVLAVLALTLNMVIVLSVLVMLHATLTLPGIAGLILLVGIAVDANVIIFERIKEELRQGKTLRASIDAGFRKAFSAIVDANLTTVITAVVLLYLGTGPIRGFAVTLIIGIFASMFTALFVTKTLAHAIVLWRKWKTLSL